MASAFDKSRGLKRKSSSEQAATPARPRSATENTAAADGDDAAAPSPGATSHTAAPRRCSLLCCPIGDGGSAIRSSEARVRVRIRPEEARRITSRRLPDAAGASCASYDGSGLADFHRDCFAALVDVAGVGRHRDRRSGNGIGVAKDAGDSTRDVAAARILATGGVGPAEAKALLRAADTAEMWDSDEELEDKADIVAKLLGGSNPGGRSPHVVAFTGAGISTSAGIGDYRGLTGKWTEDDMRDGVHGGDGESDGGKADEGEVGIPYEELRPTLTHEAISHLVARGTIDYVISQNCDGLHILSGVPKSKLSELHGNVFQEYCEKCGEEFERDRYVPLDEADEYYSELCERGRTDRLKPRGTKQCARCGLNHRTRRKCGKCSGPLRDTIINFGDLLRPHIWDPAQRHAERADVCLALGSTLTVTPACDLVSTKGGAGGRPSGELIIVNRQRTECDGKASVVVRADVDVFMRKVMQKILEGRLELAAFLRQCEEKRHSYDKSRK